MTFVSRLGAGFSAAQPVRVLRSVRSYGSFRMFVLRIEQRPGTCNRISNKKARILINLDKILKKGILKGI